MGSRTLGTGSRADEWDDWGWSHADYELAWRPSSRDKGRATLVGRRLGASDESRKSETAVAGALLAH